jgi:hypothetical protein
MQTADTQTPTVQRQVPTAAPGARVDAPTGIGDRLVVILFLIFVSLFFLISVVDLVMSLFR